MKKTLRTISALSLALLLASCGVNSINTQTTQPQSTEKSVVLEKATGIYQGEFESKFIDIQVDGKKKMYRYVDDLSSIVDSLKQKEEISIAYETNDKGERIIHLITRKNPTVAINKPIEQTNETIDSSEEKEKEWTIGEEKEESDFDAELNEDFTIENNMITYKNNKNFYALIETLPYDTSIQKERWRASPILKEIGILKEINNNYIPETSFERAEFIFAGYGEEVTGYIAVKWIDHELYRFTLNIPFIENHEEIEKELWNIVATVKKK